MPANAQVEQRSYLTLEILQDKLNNLIQQEGKETINLSNYIIDLSNSDSEFSQQFYQKLNKTISRASNPITMDFSHSIIRGDFKLNQLGIYSPVEVGALSSLFTPLEQEKIQQYYPVVNKDGKQILKINILRNSFEFNETIFTGQVDSTNSLFLQPLIAKAAIFQNSVKFNQSIFGKEVNFNEAVFSQNSNFFHSHFFAKSKFK
ncbi:MAG: pentapeptide repeat-containing protein, partial [Waterburya sp.]